MPRARIAWRDVWVGAGVTALLFESGKFLIGLYLGKTSVASGFGAAGSLVVLLVWVYFAAQIFLLGAEFYLGVLARAWFESGSNRAGIFSGGAQPFWRSGCRSGYEKSAPKRLRPTKKGSTRDSRHGQCDG